MMLWIEHNAFTSYYVILVLAWKLKLQFTGYILMTSYIGVYKIAIRANLVYGPLATMAQII